MDMLALLYVDPMAGKEQLLMTPDMMAAKNGIAYGLPLYTYRFRRASRSIRK